jgi:hypothetical protein
VSTFDWDSRREQELGQSQTGKQGFYWESAITSEYNGNRRDLKEKVESACTIC